MVVDLALIALVSPDLRSAGVATHWFAGVALVALVSYSAVPLFSLVLNS